MGSANCAVVAYVRGDGGVQPERDRRAESVDGRCLNSSLLNGDPTDDAPRKGSRGKHAQDMFNTVVYEYSSVRLARVESIAREFTKVANAAAHPWAAQTAPFDYPLLGMPHPEVPNAPPGSSGYASLSLGALIKGCEVPHGYGNNAYTAVNYR